MNQQLKLIKVVFLIVSFLALTSIAYAVPTTVNFTAYDFGANAPTDPVTGTIDRKSTRLNSSHRIR